jgi:hypothetical protein
MKTNAKEEFEEFVGGREVRCVEIIYTFNVRDYAWRYITMKTGEDYQGFLKQLEFEYTPALASTKVISGTIWFTDGSWANRGEFKSANGMELYDEFWQLHSIPKIPEDLK